MSNWFGLNLPAIVGSAIDPAMQDASLLVVTVGARNSTTSTKGLTISKEAVPCRGYVEDFAESQIDGTLITRNDRLVTLTASSLGTRVPREKDEVTVEGSTYQIRRVTRDPAGAVYRLTVRRG